MAVTTALGVKQFVEVEQKAKTFTRALELAWQALLEEVIARQALLLICAAVDATCGQTSTVLDAK